MKTSYLRKFNVKTLNKTDKVNINGGELAYDVGRVLRFLGIYYGNGGGAAGYSEAVADYAITKVECDC